MSIVTKVKPFYVDGRGEMSYLVGDDVRIRSVLLITCKKGSVRANHYHKKDSHYCYLISGQMKYVWQDLNKKGSKPQSVMVNEGEVVYSPPMTAHAMKFLKKSVFLTLATKPRTKKDYENDLVRINLI